MVKKRDEENNFEHEVAISYAGEDQQIAEQIAHSLKKKGISIFFDKFYKTDLWGKKASSWFKKTYGKSSRFVLVLVSRHYPVKDWANFEFSVATAEEKKRNKEFILPVRLDNTKLPGLSTDKIYLDFKKEGLDEIVNCLFQKVKKAASEKNPEQIFWEAYEEWKIADFLPGETKVHYFLENLSEIKLDIDTCEFLLHSLYGNYYPDLQEKIKKINKNILFNATLRLLEKDNKYYIKIHAIRYLVFVNAKKAEPYLWNIYKEEDENLTLRVAAFEKLWKSKSKRGFDESYSIATEHPKWQLRKAALKNIGHGNKRKDSSKVLSEALKDKRWEVRSEAAYAIVKLNIKDLVPNMIDALINERSRKGVNQLLYCLWNFKKHPDVKKFIKKYDLPKWFHKMPDYHATWEDFSDEML